jgi:hypothetical protein
MLELNNLRKEPASPSVNANIISLNAGMRFFRVKVKFLFKKNIYLKKLIR